MQPMRPATCRQGAPQQVEQLMLHGSRGATGAASSHTALVPYRGRQPQTSTNARQRVTKVLSRTACKGVLISLLSFLFLSSFFKVPAKLLQNCVGLRLPIGRQSGQPV